ncbi:Glycoside hydrolase family 7 protein [Venustampulla echinocandica]|uniref:cellulase n=1 Tax=Venustampulla echinocandica TaxID=2656787 RepID=A0A370TML9_9HELO|nr:Glycoside hydrolase family 7 protein [Venustampulla echinocandica]RDL36776.1 Glycoside hydrolase family 7 protein [Venustampulla echinocandica]
MLCLELKSIGDGEPAKGPGGDLGSVAGWVILELSEYLDPTDQTIVEQKLYCPSMPRSPPKAPEAYFKLPADYGFRQMHDVGHKRSKPQVLATPATLSNSYSMSFKLSFISLVASLLASIPVAQAAEEHPLLPTWKCTTSGGCLQQNTSVVLDQDSRYAKGAAGSRTAADYTAMGVATSGNALTMYHYVKTNGVLNAASPRVYLLGDDGKYVLMNLLSNQELSVDVDLSALPCGENGAFYLSEMAADGKGNAAAGNGYCDAQCQGYCCNEMDILEANSMATAMTPHPCNGNNCDKGGCGYNPYASGQRNFWAPGGTVDTRKPFTVVTQFMASGGRLSQITRKYIQNGREIGGGGTISSCGSEGSTGGLAGMGQALGRGMVLAMSIWNDAAQEMAWLDAGNNGPCQAGQGTPSVIQSQHSDTHVVFSNIRWGDVGSTTKG